jgi:hypothetical protein
MKQNDTIEMTRTIGTDFHRMKSVLACASKDPTRLVINKVLVKKEAAGITVTATDGRRLRIDHFDLEAAAGIYDIKVNSGSGVFLMRNKERLTFPNTNQVIPSLDPQDACALTGMGRRFVLWASAAQGCMINPELIALEDDEKVTLYVQKQRPDLSPAVVKNQKTTLVVMPVTVAATPLETSSYAARETLRAGVGTGARLPCPKTGLRRLRAQLDSAPASTICNCASAAPKKRSRRPPCPSNRSPSSSGSTRRFIFPAASKTKQGSHRRSGET